MRLVPDSRGCNLLHEDIKSKLSELLGAEDDDDGGEEEEALARFLVLLLARGKQRAEIAAEVDEVLPEEIGPLFVDWCVATRARVRAGAGQPCGAAGAGGSRGDVGAKRQRGWGRRGVAHLVPGGEAGGKAGPVWGCPYSTAVCWCRQVAGSACAQPAGPLPARRPPPQPWHAASGPPHLREPPPPPPPGAARLFTSLKQQPERYFTSE